MIADMLSNKKLNLVVPELFIGGRKLNISLFFYYTILFPQHTISLLRFQTNDNFKISH